MFKTKIIKHSDIQLEELKQIYKIKSAFGDFTEQSQLNWIKNNIKDVDIHFLVYKNSTLIGYANLVKENLDINNINYNILGLGNVCTSEHKKGYGSILMKKINFYLMNQKEIGLLFCKEKLLNFYVKYDWKIIQPDYKSEIKWMIYNYNAGKIIDINYKGQLF